MKNLIKTAALISTTIGLVACGGGGSSGGGGGGLSYTGVTTPATVDSTSARPLAETSATAAQKAVTDDQGADANPFAVAISGSTRSDIDGQVRDLVRNLLNPGVTSRLPIAATITANDIFGPGTSCGGSATVPDNFQTATSGTITMNNLCVDLGTVTMVFSGALDVSATGDQNGNGAGSVNIVYRNFVAQVTIVSSGETGTFGPLNGSEFCSWDGPGFANETCTSSSFYTDSSGATFQIQDSVVFGSDTIGWDVTATFYHPQFGRVEIVANDVTFNCTNGHPDSGTLSVSGANGTSIDITFIDCDTYTGTFFDGVTSTPLSGW